MKKITSSLCFVFLVLVFLIGTLLINAPSVNASAKPDLIVVKTNNINNTAFVGHSFTWSIHITSANNTASFNKNKIIFTDNLPSSGATYSNFSFTPTNIGGTSDLNCTLSESNISCFSGNNGNGIDIPTNGSIDISVLVTPTTAGSLVNPKSGGICKVDPNDAVKNESNENNNTCSNTVTINNPAHIIVIKNAIPNSSQDFTFQNNFGNGNPSTFLLDDDSNNILPNTRNSEVLPGTYSVSEDQAAGWKQGSQTCTGNGNTPGNITVGAGETVTCAFVNKKLATITLVKNTVGGDGIFNFTMTGATLPASAQLTTVNSAATQTFNNIDPDNTYSIAEIVPTGWNLTSSSCAGTNTPSKITPNNGETITCTFTNTKRGSLIIHKTVLDPNGGILTANDTHAFTVTVNGSNSKTLAQGTDVVYSDLTPGDYTISENPDDNYTLDSSLPLQVTIVSGENKEITLVNKQKPGKIIIDKTTIGGSGTFAFDGDHGLGSKQIITSAPNVSNTDSFFDVFTDLNSTFTITEEAQAGWTPDQSACQVVVKPGETKTCAFINTIVPPTLTIIKNTNGGDGTFNFTVTKDGQTVVAEPAITTHGGTGQAISTEMLALNLTAGHYTVSEVPQTGWDLNSASCEKEGNSKESLLTALASSNEFTADIGESWTCIFTNTKRGSIKAHEDVVAPDGATDVFDNHKFNVTINGGNQKSVSENSDVEYDNLIPGTYTIAEIGDPDFDLLRIASGEVIVTAGQNTDVIITNKQKQGHLAVTKVVNNPNGGTAVSSNFTMKVKGTNVSNSEFPGDDKGVTVTLDPGPFEVSESGPNGYSLISSENCSGTIGSNKNLTCTITNSDIADGYGAITVKKHVINDNGGAATADAFTIHVENEDEGDVENSPSNGSETGALYTLLAGSSYTISENETVAGYALTGISCAPVGGGESVAGETSVTLELSNQQAYVCAITNDDIAPKLHLRKVVVNDNGGTATVANFTLKADGAGLNDISGISPVDSGAGLKADTFALSETNPGGYTASDWSCIGGAQDGSNITLSINQEATCAITNTAQLVVTQGTLIIKKIIVNDNGGTKTANNFSFKINDGNAVVFEADGQNDTVVEAGAYSIIETADSNYATSYNNCANVNVPAGGEATCTITNDDIPAPIISEETTPIQELTATSFTTVWTTDHPATSRAIYDTVSHSILGDAPNYGYANSTTEDATLATFHSVTVSGLTAGAVYFYRNISHGSPESVSSEKSTTTAALVPASSPVSASINKGKGRPMNLAANQTSEAPATKSLETPPAGDVLGAEKFVFTQKIKLGSKGNEVIELEKALSVLGLYKGAIDGKFGKTLRTAIKAYQKANPPLKVDGIVGPATRAVLNK